MMDRPIPPRGTDRGEITAPRRMVPRPVRGWRPEPTLICDSAARFSRRAGGNDLFSDAVDEHLAGQLTTVPGQVSVI